jgi:hypothetical protein
MKNERYWLEKDELLLKLENRKIIFWGSGTWVEKSIKLLKLTPNFIVDKSKNIQGYKQRGIEVISYDNIKNKDEFYIIITTGSYKSLIFELTQIGLQAGNDFCCSPVLKNLRVRDNMLSINKDILFSVPLLASDGGGLYKYNTKLKEYSKIIEGKSRALSKSDNYIVLVDELQGVILFNKKLEIIKTIDLLNNSIPHGVAISEKMNKIFVANTGRDSISIFDLLTYRHLKEIKLSSKYNRMKEEQHHINDLFVDEDLQTLYISMFSFTGNWRKDVQDGGVLEYDLFDDKFIGPVISNMWKPHSIQVQDNSLVVLDSMRGDLYKTSNKVIGNFQGFIRGLDYDNQFFYIGQSTHRYFDRLQGVALNIPLNCGIHIFDEITKASVFHSFYEFENIHSILVLN